MYIFCTLTLGRQRWWLLRLPMYIIIISCYTLIPIIQLYILRYKNPNAPPSSPHRPHTTIPLIIVIVVTVTVVGRPFLWRRRRAPLSQVAAAVAVEASSSSSTRRYWRHASSDQCVRRRCTAIAPSTLLALLVSNELCIDARARSFESKCACYRQYYIFLFKKKNYNNKK